MREKVIVFLLLLVMFLSLTIHATDVKGPGSLKRIKQDSNSTEETRLILDIASPEMSPAAVGCTTLSYHGAAAYYWTIPDAYGDNFFNERFDIPYDGYLKEIRIMFYAAGSIGYPDALIYVWNSDGTLPIDPSPPSGAIANFTIPYSGLRWYPDWNVLNVESSQIWVTKDDRIHVGYSFNNLSYVLATLSDNGSNNSTRSSEYWGSWSTMLADWHEGVDFLIEVVVCQRLRGDANNDGKLAVSDVIYLVNYLFKGGPPPNPLFVADVNCDGLRNVSDIIYLVNYLFKGGPPPC